jgi:hypothetical protein
MRKFHEYDENNPLDFLIVGVYILYQTLGQITDGPSAPFMG